MSKNKSSRRSQTQPSKQPNTQVAISRYHEEFYQGALPKADELEKYALIIPNGAERIMAMAEKEQNHVHKEEGLDRATNRDLARSGQKIAAVLTLACIISAVWLILLGHDTAGNVFGGVGLLQIIGAFISNVKPIFSKKPKTERNDLNKE